MVTRRQFLLSSAAALAAPAPHKPNIVVILADDLGYGELTCQGFTSEIPTPNIDSIARRGVRFTNGYVSCPVCSPTRAGLMTGRYQQRFGHEFNPGPAEEAAETFGLPLSETTLASRLKQAGYATGLTGKWHLGFKPEFHPLRRGFDEYFGFLGGAHPYLDGDRRAAILRGTDSVREKEYLTDAFTREAVSFIGRHRNEPFLLYLAYNAVHAPLEAPEKYLSRFASIADPTRRTFAAMLSALDDGVGAVLKKLRDDKLEDDTLLIFLSDNGGPTPRTTSGNGPLRGYKGQVWEGGIRIPFMMQWPGRVPAGKADPRPVIALDIAPTALAAAGAPVAGLDGIDLLSTARHPELYWRFGAQGAIRAGDWKLVRLPRQQPQLFNLSRDIGESKDLAASEPARAKELETAWQSWNAQLAQPRWTGGSAAVTKQQKRALRRKQD